MPSSARTSATSRWPIRRQAAGIVAVVMAVALGVAGTLVIGALSNYLHAEARRLVDTRLTRVTTAVQRAADSPGGLGGQGGDVVGRPLLRTTGDITAIQVIGPDGVVIGASELAPTVPLTRAHPEHWGVRLRTVQTTGGAVTVAVAYDTSRVDATMHRVTTYLLITWPVAVLVAALLAHEVAGRSLSAVERMRAEAARIEGGSIDARLPVPETGDELTSLATTLNSMLSRLAASHRAQRQFVADASHEIRSPLATITTALELGQGDPGVLDGELIGTTLLPAGRRLQAIVDDLLLLARSDEQGLQGGRADVDLDEVVHQACAAAVVQDSVRVEQDVEPVRVRGHESQLARAVQNLVDNAVRHARSRVQVVCRVVPDGASLTVDDDGPGIPAELRSRVFERFVRLDDSRSRDSGGAGLGLAIVAEIAHAHGGSIRVQESPLGGARFLLTLPLGTMQAQDHGVNR